MTQTPTVGRIVHIAGEEFDQPIAAIITAVHDNGVQVTAFMPGRLPGYVTTGPKGTPAETHIIPFAETPTPGHWNWPPRVDNTTSVNVVADAVPTVVTDIERQNLGYKRAETGLRDSQRAVREAQQNLRDTYRNG